MGLLDDPLGFVLGSDGDQGAVDRRVNREDEGERWWQRWEAVFGQDGPLDPLSVYPKALASMDKMLQTAPTYTLNIDGKNYRTQPSWARALPFNYASAVSSLMSPWLQGGLELERGRYGNTYYQGGSGGLLGDVLGNLGRGAGNALPFYAMSRNQDRQQDYIDSVKQAGSSLAFG